MGRINELTPIINFKKNNISKFKKMINPLQKTKDIYKQRNQFEEIDLKEDEDGSTLVFGDGHNQTHEADQNQKDESDIPAYMRKQNQ